MDRKYKYFTREEYTKGRDKDYPLSADQENNMHDLLTKADKLREHWSKPLSVSSGYRDSDTNKRVGGSKRSSHLLCMAIDFFDKDGALAKYCLDNLSILEELGLYMEDPKYTKGWVHLQTRATSQRVFIP
jgi:hypothetical protein